MTEYLEHFRLFKSAARICYSSVGNFLADAISISTGIVHFVVLSHCACTKEWGQTQDIPLIQGK